MNEALSQLKAIISDFKAIIFIIIALLIFYTLFSYTFIQSRASSNFTIDEKELAVSAKDIKVAIVFGGGVDENSPLPLLQGRLDTAKALLDKGIVRKLLLSGDNTLENYNEPQKMHEYLVEKGVPRTSLEPDFDGRSTFEACERAYKIFGIEEAILVTEAAYLPRASFLCNHLGVRNIGVVSDGLAASQAHLSQSWSEVLARNKAIFNVYIKGEQTILGEKVNLNL